PAQGARAAGGGGGPPPDGHRQGPEDRPAGAPPGRLRLDPARPPYNRCGRVEAKRTLNARTPSTAKRTRRRGGADALLALGAERSHGATPAASVADAIAADLAAQSGRASRRETAS